MDSQRVRQDWVTITFNFHLYMTTGKTIALTIRPFVHKMISLLSNMLSRFVIVFLPWSKLLLISWLQSPSTVILEPKKIKSVTVSTFPLFYLPWSDETGCHDLSFLNVAFQASLFTFLFCPHQKVFSSSSLLPLGWYYLHMWVCWYFSQKSWFQLMNHPDQNFTWCTLPLS